MDRGGFSATVLLILLKILYYFFMIREKLQNDVKEALKSGDSEKRVLLGMVLSAIKNKEFEKRAKLSKAETDIKKVELESQLNDEEIIEVLFSEIKKRKESVESYTKGGRADLAEKEEKELTILMSYMPEQMPEDAIRAIVKKTLADLGLKDIKDMGKAIGAVMAQVKGKADGTVVSRIVKEELGK